MKSQLAQIKNICFLIIGCFFTISNNAQQIHVDYIQKEGNADRFTIEVWVSSQHEQPVNLSALNTVFEFSDNALERGDLSFVLAPKFSRLAQPVTSILAERQKLRSTMIPVKEASQAIKLSNQPELFGVLTFVNKSGITYPKVITPSVTGNPTVQALVYVENAVNSTALTLSQMSITTDENPLVLRLMPTKLNVQPTLHEIDIYPNPTTNQLYYNIVSEANSPIEEISVLDAQGRVVMKIADPGQLQGNIDLTSYAPGMYYLMIKQDESISRHKVIKI